MARGPATGKVSRQSSNPVTGRGGSYTAGSRGSVGTGQTPRAEGGWTGSTPHGTATRNTGGTAIHGGSRDGAKTVTVHHEHHHYMHKDGGKKRR